MKSMLAQLLWNPQRDGRALITMNSSMATTAPRRPPSPAISISFYEASDGHNLTCYSGTDASFLRFKPLAESNIHWKHLVNCRKSSAACDRSDGMAQRIAVYLIAVKSAGEPDGHSRAYLKIDESLIPN